MPAKHVLLLPPNLPFIFNTRQNCITDTLATIHKEEIDMGLDSSSWASQWLQNASRQPRKMAKKIVHYQTPSPSSQRKASAQPVQRGPMRYLYVKSCITSGSKQRLDSIRLDAHRACPQGSCTMQTGAASSDCDQMALPGLVCHFRVSRQALLKRLAINTGAIRGCYSPASRAALADI